MTCVARAVAATAELLPELIHSEKGCDGVKNVAQGQGFDELGDQLAKGFHGGSCVGVLSINKNANGATAPIMGAIARSQQVRPSRKGSESGLRPLFFDRKDGLSPLVPSLGIEKDSQPGVLAGGLAHGQYGALVEHLAELIVVVDALGAHHASKARLYAFRSPKTFGSE